MNLRQGSSSVALDGIGFLSLKGNDSDAWRIIELQGANTPEMLIAQAYMLVDRSERREDAMALCDAAVKACPTWWMRQMASKVLLLLGETERAKAVCSTRIKSDVCADITCPWIWLDRKSIEFIAGDIGVEKYRRADETMGGKFYYHYTIGCLAAGQGESERARAHLQLCVDNSSFLLLESNWARLFLQRLESNAEWPEADGREARQTKSVKGLTALHVIKQTGLITRGDKNYHFTDRREYCRSC